MRWGIRERGELMSESNPTRRDVLAAMAGMGALGLVPTMTFAQDGMPLRRIPGTDESLPLVGLGSSKPVSQIAERGKDPIAGVLRALVANGGRVVDTWPRNADNDAAFGEVLSEPDLREELFVASKIDRTGREEGISQFRETLRLYQRDTIDLLQVFSLTDLETQWANLKDFREQGAVRYIGVTVANNSLYEPLSRFVQNEQPD
ncbi:MAG: aldo/keto reductase, partial [Gammaproteobacteria bacterium]|nr:aldo/keto reductase [Gammaproteobacteria bacterium]